MNADAIDQDVETQEAKEDTHLLGCKSFLKDGFSGIDYILAWSSTNLEEEKRTRFEDNLTKEGLVLESDIKDGRPHQFVKIHAPGRVLTRYAEILKIRLPIKETLANLNPVKEPYVRRKFTYPLERNKMYLYDIPGRNGRLLPDATCSRIVDYILCRTGYSEEKQVFSFGIKRLISDGTYLAAYPLHEGEWKRNCEDNSRKLLFENWASWRVWYKKQPLDDIRAYFGEKIGLYFAWLGHYTRALIPASVVGLLVFIFGLATISQDPISIESCNPNNNYTMCPLCNGRCGYWSYDQLCVHMKATHMFDNGATVFFAVFMSLWGTCYLEFWKRKQARIQFMWDVRHFEEEEEPERPEYQPGRAAADSWTRRIPVYLTLTGVMLFLVLVAIAVMIGIGLYRISVLAALHMIDEPIVYKNASLVASASAAFINLIIIFILNHVYIRVATGLTNWECPRTQSEYEDSLTFKFYVLEFVNYYSSLFYIAFFKGRFVGEPSNYMTFFGARHEECQGGSCLTELCIQLAIIFVGKQLIQNVGEHLVPRLKLACSSLRQKKNEDVEVEQRWETDFRLANMSSIGHFHEYLELIMQFGFVTMFVAAFPLAPLFALLNNIVELRGDAQKLVTQYRRRMAARAQDIGIWYYILHALTRIAVLTNGLIIAFTSSFIDRAVYRFMYSPDQSLNGFVNNSLAYFNVSHFPPGSRPYDNEIKPQYNNTELCRYRDYREPPWSPDKYNYTTQHWHVLAAQFIFLVVFENLVIFTTSAIAYVIPDIPRKMTEQMRREATIMNDINLEMDLRQSRDENRPKDAVEDAKLLESVLVSVRSRIGKQGRNGGTLESIVLGQSS